MTWTIFFSNKIWLNKFKLDENILINPLKKNTSKKFNFTNFLGYYINK